KAANFDAEPLRKRTELGIALVVLQANELCSGNGEHRLPLLEPCASEAALAGEIAAPPAKADLQARMRSAQPGLPIGDPFRVGSQISSPRSKAGTRGPQDRRQVAGRNLVVEARGQPLFGMREPRQNLYRWQGTPQ